MNLEKVLRLMYWLAGICLVLLLFGFWAENTPLILLGIGASLGMVFVNLKYWRCPRCGGHLGRDMGKFCRHCGAPLKDLQNG